MDVATAIGKCLHELWHPNERPEGVTGWALAEYLNDPHPIVLGYDWGGTGWGPSRKDHGDVDCSGFMSAVLQRVGSIPIGMRFTTSGLPTLGWRRVKPGKGTLVLYQGHVGLALGGGYLLDAGGEGRESTDVGRVRVVRVDRRGGIQGHYMPPPVGTHRSAALVSWVDTVRHGQPLASELREAGWRAPRSWLEGSA